MTSIEIYEESGVQKTNSKNIAEVFGKTHRDVVRAINNLDCSPEFRERNFAQSSYLSAQNKSLKCIEITKDGFAFLCMGFTGKKSAEFKEAYISEFNRMADALNSISDRINRLSSEGEKIKELGTEWARLGHEVNKHKKKHKEASELLMSEVQLKLDLM